LKNFIREVPNLNVKEILTYNEIREHIKKDNNEKENVTEKSYKFWTFLARQRPLRSSDKDCKGSTYNVLVKWETEDSTYEPFEIIGKDHLVTCAQYAKKHNLLEIDGWQRFRPYSKNCKKLERMVYQAKHHNFRREPYWKTCVLVPQMHQQAVDIDKKNKNKLWKNMKNRDATDLQYKKFIDNGKDTLQPTGYKRKKCHKIYDFKHVVLEKAQIVAGGHLTYTN
jgi:hypothetical protein